MRSYSDDDPEGWNHLLDQARAADVSGVDRISVGDHVVFGENMDAYGNPALGGTEGGRQPTGSDGRWLEPMTVLSVMCGITSRVRLATTILLAALRRPVVLAKAAATLDVLSGGRLDLGVGVGWQREEYEAAGLAFDRRGRTLDHTLAVLQTLWRANPSHFHSEELDFRNIHCLPKPVQPGGVPIWVSGTSNPRVLERIVRFGDGWIPWGPDLLDPLPGAELVRRELRQAGRDADGFRIMGTLRLVRAENGAIDFERSTHAVAPWLQAGITDFRIGVDPPNDFDAARDYFSELVVAFEHAASWG